MKFHRLLIVSIAACFAVMTCGAQARSACFALNNLKIHGVEITGATEVAANAPLPSFYPRYTGSLPEHCRVEGVIHPRKGVDGVEYGIGFAVALPAKGAWKGDFMMQGGGGSNGIINYPAGNFYAGDRSALERGFAVASTDTGHKSRTGFDFSFIRDQQAYLDFAYQANAEVADVAKRIIARYYNRPAAYSYFVGCSTGGREGMILSQRFPTVFNGIVVGDPAMRTGLSNLAIGQWIPVAWNQAAPKDASGKPEIEKLFTDADRKLIIDALMKKCDALDGLADGMILNPLACHFDPEEIACRPGQREGCLAPEKAAAIKKAFAGPKNAYGTQVYPGFLYDSGIAASGPLPGLLNPHSRGLFGPVTTATTLDVDKAALHGSEPLVEPAATNLSTFSGNGGKLIFFHGDSDPWFSPLDTLRYYQSLAAANGGAEQVTTWSRFFFVPGMSHCGGGPSLDHFDMLDAVVDWVEKGKAPDSIIATGKAFPGRSRPLCAYPTHAQYSGHGDTQDAGSFVCRK